MLYTLILILFVLWLVFALVVIASSLVGFLQTRVPFVPTSACDVKMIVDNLKLSEKDTVYDLGSGDGRVLFLMEKLCGAKGVGFELTWWTYAFSVLKLKVKSKKLKVEFRNQNFFKAHWGEATVVYAYLYPPLMGQVEEKFLKDCKPGTLAVVRDFPFPNIKPTEVYESGFRVPFYKGSEKAERTPTVADKLRYLALSFWHLGKPSRHEVYVYRKE